MVSSTFVKYGIFSIMGVAIVMLITIGIDEAIESLDRMLIPCQHGTTYANGKCSCVDTPFVGHYCATCNCTTGYCVIGGTTPRITSDYGCKCPQQNKFFGFLCDQCNAVNKTYTETIPPVIKECKGTCEEGYFGSRCDRKCFANVSHTNTLSIDAAGDDLICKNLRVNGGECNACSGHGSCKDGFCECFDHWYDNNMEKCSMTCPLAPNGKMCSGRGVCKLYGNTPGCLCESGWRGSDCTIACPGMEDTGKACNGHGSCTLDYEQEPIEASCRCNDKYRGDACEVECPGVGEACSGHGTCLVENGEANCICQTGMLDWNGVGCNCTDLLSCNGRGTCVDGICNCEGNYDGANCLKCKKNYWGSECQWYCNPDEDHDDDPDKVGCHGRGVCTIFNMDTVFESIGCTCRRDEVRRKINGKFTAFYSAYSPDLNCKDCYSSYFPKLDIFNTYDTTPSRLWVPCQVPCAETTCNEIGVCNEMYGKPGETLCMCDTGPDNNKHISENSYCTKCDMNWYPEKVRESHGCTNFCINDLTLIGGSFPNECEAGDIDCIHCNGAGSCNADGQCECQEGFTGDMCQIQCTSPDGVICGGHGACESSDMQLLLQHELAYVEDSGPSFTCICDPQDTYTKEARENYAIEGGEGELAPPPDPTFFGETCDYHCERPPWGGSDECNGLGNCTIFQIADPNDNLFECHSDLDCEATDVTRILSLDSSWTSKKGPFCHKNENPEGCDDDEYNIDNCIDILTLQRPPQARAKRCVEDTLCRQTLDSYDWHTWCTNVEEVSSPALFETCGAITQFCPSQAIDAKCTEYVSLSTGTDISNHMDYCYENDKKKYPFKQTNAYRLSDISAEWHDLIDTEMIRYNTEHPEVDIDITPYCTEHMKKFDTVVSEVNENKRYICGTSIIADEQDCFSNAESANWKPFSVTCPNEEKQMYATLVEAESNRKLNCVLKEDEPRKVVPNAGFVQYGSLCYADSDCENGKCNGNTCCTDFDFTNCESCNNIGECAACKPGTAWDGLSCAGTPEEEPSPIGLTGAEQKLGLDMIDNTCSEIDSKFPICIEPQHPCDIGACKDGDTCTVKGNDAICETTGVLDCACGYGLECVPLTFTTYKCVGEFESSTCPQNYMNFNWFGYCKDNSPVIKHVKFGSDFLTQHDPTPGQVITVGAAVDYISYWVQPTTIFSTSKYIEVTNGEDVITRVYLHQGQIQLNNIQALESCPLTNPTCQEDWGYEPNVWYNLELSIDYTNREITLKNLQTGVTLTDTFLCVENECHSIASIDELTINGETETFYDEILFEKEMPLPSLYESCNSYSYCDMNVDYRSICSDVIRNVEYPLLLEPKHDILETCANFFEYQSFDTYSLTNSQQVAIENLDWDNYCLFTESITGDHDCGSTTDYTYFENYNNCRDLLEPLDGSKQCMVDAMGYDWAQYCVDLEMAAIPTVIKESCPLACYRHLKDYTNCEERLALYSSNKGLQNSNCPDKWYSFCHDVALDKHTGVCSGIDCDCDIDKYEGVSGNSCELHCHIASDGSACGELTGVGKCVYTEEQQEQLDSGTYDSDGNLIAFNNVFEINGKCDCFLSEGKKNCDQECMNCNEDAYNEIVISPTDTSQWSGDVSNTNNLHLGNADTTSVSNGEYVILDMQEDDIVTGVVTNNVAQYSISISTDNVFYEELNCGTEDDSVICQPSTVDTESTLKIRGFGRFVKFTFLEAATVKGLGVKITRSGQIGICNGGTGVCDCLPPFASIIEEKYTNWRGIHRKRLNRVHSLPPLYDAEEEFRIRAMQGKEIFTKHILKTQDGDLAYTSGPWKTVYHNFRDNPSSYMCMPDRTCTHHDFILLGNLAGSSYRYNYDCNTECEGVDPVTKIPCSGHGSCRVTGDCTCDPAAYVKGVNEVTGFSMEFNIAGGDVIDQSDYQVSSYEKTGWRGAACDTMCPGYDPVTKSMLNVCGGRGVCNDDAECECELGYTGEYCQFTCPGFEEGEQNVCSGHGTCTLNLIEIILAEEVVLYDGYCTDWKYINDEYVFDQTVKQCVDLCVDTAGDYTGAVRSADGSCFCSAISCPDENIREPGAVKTYTLIGSAGSVDPIDCDGTWTDWSVCDGERESREFTVSVAPLYGGQSCPVTPEYRTCFLPNTDCDGTWSTWTACDGEFETREFAVSQQPVRFGFACPLSPQKRVCSLPKVDCEGTWSTWTTCDASLLTQTRTFTITQNPENLGLSCPTSPHTIDCSDQQVNCEYTDNGWGECDQGSQTKTYTTTQEPALGGVPCPVDETRTCSSCTEDSKCTSGSCKGEYCCNSNFALCGACDSDGYCAGCIQHATTQINGNCECDEGYLYDSNECKVTWDVPKEPIYQTRGGWSDWSTCLAPGSQTRVRNKDVILSVSHDGVNDFSIDGISDPHLLIEKQMMDTNHYIVPYVDTYTAKVSITRVNSEYDARLVRESDCPTCFSGQWAEEPVSTVTNVDGTLLSDIIHGEPTVEWIPLESGVYYLITPQNNRMITKLTVQETFTGEHNSYETQSCDLIEDLSYCTVSRECASGACIPEAFGDNKRCSSDSLCKTIDENDCTACREGATGTPCSCPSATSEIEDDLLECAASRRRLLNKPENYCKENSDCESSICLGGRCCNKEHPYCESCNKNGHCLRCEKDAQWVNGTCKPVDCSKHHGFTHMKYIEGRGCLHSLGSTSCTADDQCGEGTNGKCIGGVCCHEDYEDTSNCRTCNDGTSVWEYQVASGYLAGGPAAEETCTDNLPNCAQLSLTLNCDTDPRMVGCLVTCNKCGGVVPNLNFFEPLKFTDAIEECDRFTTCKGIYHRDDDNDWYLRNEETIIQDPSASPNPGDYTTYAKVMLPNQHCSRCFDNAEWFDGRGKCKGLVCPTGQQWIDNVGCATVRGEADEKMQIPVQTALSEAFCSAGFYRDTVTNNCKPIQEHPMINVTLYIDEGTPDEVKMRFGCEVWAPNVVKCPQCNCFFDYIYGKWSSFECETCLKGYGQKQCRKQCPGYDGENDISMCNGFGSCATGSVVNSDGQRNFQDSTCTCGFPPGSVNEAGTEMQIYNSFYTELTTITEQAELVSCHNEVILEDDLVDTCYHFDDTFADCSKCDDGFSGFNCKYKCEKCLMGGRCDSSPSDKKSSVCECKELFGIQAGLWSFNCCPVGWRVTDVIAFNAYEQEHADPSVFTVDTIALPSLYNPDRYESMDFEDSKRNADYWCKPCPGVDTRADGGSWLSTQAQYQVCGGVTRGECYRKNSTHNGCKCLEGNGGNLNDLTQDFVGMACRCRPQDPAPYVSLLEDYGCDGKGQCLDDVVNIGGVNIACGPNAGYYSKIVTVDGKTVTEITPSACGTFIPFDGQLYITDMSNSGEECNYAPGGTCQRCNNGYFQDGTANTGCKACPMGQYTPSDGGAYCSCIPCGAGTISSNGNSDGASGCISCNSGEYQDVTGQGVCKKCARGWYSDNSGAKITCTECWPGSRSILGTGGTHVSSGPDGVTTHDGRGSGSCTGCNSGEYQDQTGQHQCTKCPKGKATSSDSVAWDNAAPYVSSCATCAAGRYSNLKDDGTHVSNSGLPTTYDGTGSDRCNECSKEPYNTDSYYWSLYNYNDRFTWQYGSYNTAYRRAGSWGRGCDSSVTLGYECDYTSEAGSTTCHQYTVRQFKDEMKCMDVSDDGSVTQHTLGGKIYLANARVGRERWSEKPDLGTGTYKVPYSPTFSTYVRDHYQRTLPIYCHKKCQENPRCVGFTFTIGWCHYIGNSFSGSTADLLRKGAFGQWERQPFQPYVANWKREWAQTNQYLGFYGNPDHSYIYIECSDRHQRREMEIGEDIFVTFAPCQDLKEGGHHGAEYMGPTWGDEYHRPTFDTMFGGDGLPSEDIFDNWFGYSRVRYNAECVTGSESFQGNGIDRDECSARCSAVWYDGVGDWSYMIRHYLRQTSYSGDTPDYGLGLYSSFIYGHSNAHCYCEAYPLISQSCGTDNNAYSIYQLYQADLSWAVYVPDCKTALWEQGDHWTDEDKDIVIGVGTFTDWNNDNDDKGLINMELGYDPMSGLAGPGTTRNTVVDRGGQFADGWYDQWDGSNYDDSSGWNRYSPMAWLGWQWWTYSTSEPHNTYQVHWLDVKNTNQDDGGVWATQSYIQDVGSGFSGGWWRKGGQYMTNGETETSIKALGERMAWLRSDSNYFGNRYHDNTDRDPPRYSRYSPYNTYRGPETMYGEPSFFTRMLYPIPHCIHEGGPVDCYGEGYGLTTIVFT